MATLIDEIEYYRGDSYPIDLTIKTPTVGGVPGVAIDITGYSFILTVASKVDPIDDTFKIFTIVGVLNADPTTGKVSFTPTSEQNNILKKTYYYDIQMTDASGNIRTISKNKYIISQDITK